MRHYTSSSQSWLTIDSISNGAINISFTANTNAGSRTADIYLFGAVIPVTQTALPYSLSADLLFEAPSAGNDSVTLVQTENSTTPSWTATANVSWLHLSPANQSGSGAATLEFTFDSNPGPQRSGTITIAGETLTVVQASAPYYLNTTMFAEPDTAGSNGVVLTVSISSATWMATANASWLHLSPANQSGTGTATVEFSFDANTGPARSGTLTVAGFTVTIVQSGSAYSLRETVLREQSSAGSDGDVLTVSPPTGTWTATANAGWLHLSPDSQSGTGGATLQFSFDANPGPTRTSTFTIAGMTLTIIQNSANFSLGASSLAEGPAAGIDSIVLGANPNSTPWTATPNADWLHLSAANQSGTGSTNLVFSFDTNPGPTRSGTLTIGGETLTVMQAGSTYVAARPLAIVANADQDSDPEQIATDPAGNVYIAAAGENRIDTYTAANGALTDLFDLSVPLGVAVDGLGNVYIADNMIQKWTSIDGSLTTLVSSGLNGPKGLAVDGFGNVFIADTGNDALKEWMVADSNVVTLATNFNQPWSVAVDAAGNAYVADLGNNAIKEWVAGNSNVVTLITGLDSPSFVGVDGAGNVYGVDAAGMGYIAKWTAASGNISAFLDLPNFNFLGGMTFNSVGDAYIANSDALDEMPNAFVDPTPKLESAAAGNDALQPVIPSTENLVGPFAPVSDQSWLTITGTTNGVVSFSVAANPGLPRFAYITLLDQAIPVIQVSITPPRVLAALPMQGNNVLQFGFGDDQNTSFTVFSATNLAVPLNGWTMVGGASNIGPGLFEFTSSATTNDSQRFYRVQSP